MVCLSEFVNFVVVCDFDVGVLISGKCGLCRGGDGDTASAVVT